MWVYVHICTYEYMRMCDCICMYNTMIMSMLIHARAHVDMKDKVCVYVGI